MRHAADDAPASRQHQGARGKSTHSSCSLSSLSSSPAVAVLLSYPSAPLSLSHYSSSSFASSNPPRTANGPSMASSSVSDFLGGDRERHRLHRRPRLTPLTPPGRDDVDDDNYHRNDDDGVVL